MKTRGNTFSIFKTNRHLGLALLGCLLLQGVVSAAPAKFSPAQVVPPDYPVYGKTYADWSVAWWQWALRLPKEGHPFDPGVFDVTEGQSGPVWFLASPVDIVERTCTIPANKALFIETLTSEWSDLEGCPTEEDQRGLAEVYASGMCDVFFRIDGVPLSNLGAYMIETEQFSFKAPTLWYYYPVEGGKGKTVAKGYCFLLAPLSVGSHTLHYGGKVHLSVAEGDAFDYDAVMDVTYHLNVKKGD